MYIWFLPVHRLPPSNYDIFLVPNEKGQGRKSPEYKVKSYGCFYDNERSVIKPLYWPIKGHHPSTTPLAHYILVGPLVRVQSSLPLLHLSHNFRMFRHQKLKITHILDLCFLLLTLRPWNFYFPEISRNSGECNVDFVSLCVSFSLPGSDVSTSHRRGRRRVTPGIEYSMYPLSLLFNKEPFLCSTGEIRNGLHPLY